MPLVIVPLFLIGLQHFTYPMGSRLLDRLWELFCFAISLLGTGGKDIYRRACAKGDIGKNYKHTQGPGAEHNGDIFHRQTSPLPGKLHYMGRNRFACPFHVVDGGLCPCVFSILRKDNRRRGGVSLGKIRGGLCSMGREDADGYPKISFGASRLRPFSWRSSSFVSTRGCLL